jgi:hypothetical protein
LCIRTDDTMLMHELSIDSGPNIYN